eukprot:954701-Ditylum_brightwellii.AAC.1
MSNIEQYKVLLWQWEEWDFTLKVIEAYLICTESVNNLVMVFGVCHGKCQNLSRCCSKCHIKCQYK